MTEKKTEPQRRTYEGLGLLTKEIRHVTKPILGKRGFSGTDIVACWDELLGPDLARGVRPEKLTFEKDARINGTLHVKSAGGAFAMLFEHQKQRVIERINTFFGYPAVARIKIIQGTLKLKPIAPQKVQKTVSAADKEALMQQVSVIDDPDLREATYQIGLTRLAKRQ